MNVSRTKTSKRIQRRFSVYQQQSPKSTEQQQQKVKQEKLQKQQDQQDQQHQDQQQQLSQAQVQDQKDKYEEKEVKQDQKKIKQDQEQNLDEEQKLNPAEEQEQEKTEDPQLKTKPSQATKKESKDTQTRKEQNFWYWVPHLTDNSPWECLVKGKGQEILETVFNSTSRSKYTKFTCRHRRTEQTTETAQHSTHGSTSTQPRTRSSNPSHEARPTGMQHRPGTSAGCSNNVPGTRNVPQSGPSHGGMTDQQMFLSFIQETRSMGFDPNMFSLLGLPVPAQNPAAPDGSQRPPNVNFVPPTPSSLESSLNETLNIIQEIMAGTVALCRQQPELTLDQMKRKIRGLFHQMITEPANKPQQ
ncbi:ras-interacting protein RIP3-like [Schistocerca gregaria]|uniref:ras-interacting protein RIP3-like n=1 Tax=Schistocerca gregaria TaxID=7010 RepID=UPI00211E6DD6|nr:ras-interacting protein RIP3-like [Schistocerca gregaria]